MNNKRNPARELNDYGAFDRKTGDSLWIAFRLGRENEFFYVVERHGVSARDLAIVRLSRLGIDSDYSNVRVREMQGGAPVVIGRPVVFRDRTGEVFTKRIACADWHPNLVAAGAGLRAETPEELSAAMSQRARGEVLAKETRHQKRLSGDRRA